MPSPLTTRCAWGVPQGWAASFDGWENSVRRWVRECRASGLTRIDVRIDPGRPHTVQLQAMRPELEYEDVA